MKRILSTLAFVFAIAICSTAQVIKDPADWSFSVKKKDAKHYTILIHAAIKPTWHMYALQPGGDGTLIPTSVKFTPAPGVVLSGKIRETSRAVNMAIEGVDGRVNLYSGKADFEQDVIASAGKIVLGSVEYQACNDQMCLPPKNKIFSVTLR